MSIRSNIAFLREQIPENVSVVAVSKFQSLADIEQAYEAGQRLFGESRVQEITQKQRSLPTDIEWHFIGNLQRNKVKYIAPFVHLIHSVDSERLLKEIDKQGRENQRAIPCLLQLHIAREETKSGFTLDDCRALLDKEPMKKYPHARLRGVMGMATFTDDKARVRDEFRSLRDFFDEIKKKYFADTPFFNEISMGMSGDYAIAVEEGSTIVRLGTSIFGAR